jgi:4'-phosphopantetheinyl transferase
VAFERALADACKPRVWRVRAACPSVELERHLRALDETERTRAARFRQSDDRVRFVLGRSSLRRLLSWQLGLEADTLVFGANAFGKPFLLSPNRPLHFNSSHSGEWILHAFDKVASVGIDVEAVRPAFARSADFSVALSPEELRRMGELPQKDRARALARTWVSKEAYLKALGEGLSRAPQQIAIRTDPEGKCSLLYDRNVPRAPGEWAFHDIPLDANHVACLVTCSPHRQNAASRVPEIRDFQF